MASPTATPQLYDDMGIQYEDNFAHDQGLISFIDDDMITLTHKSATFLDLGTGTGKPVAAALAAAGRQIHAVDYSSAMLTLAQKAVPSGTFEQASILNFQPSPSGRTFDAVVTSMSLFNFTPIEMKQVAKSAAKWVSKGGYWFIVTIEQGKYGSNERKAVGEHEVDEGARTVDCNFLGRKVNILLYTEEGWEKLLNDAGWEIVRTKKHFFEMKGEGEDEPHYFIVARKA